MLDLIISEFTKIKRQRFILFSMLAACLFPIPMTILVAKDRLEFDTLFNLAVMFGHFLLLPCVLSMVAAILFFMERDNDTLKNLVTIPVSKVKLVAAKLSLLLGIAILYSIAGLGSTIIGGLIVGGIREIAYKLVLSIVLGVMTFVATLPVVALIVYFNKSYIFSILIAFFYSIFNFIIAYGMLDFDPDSILLTVLPVPVIMRWLLFSEMGHTAEPFINSYIVNPYLLSDPVCAGILSIIAAISIPLIVLAYKKQEN